MSAVTRRWLLTLAALAPSALAGCAHASDATSQEEAEVEEYVPEVMIASMEDAVECALAALGARHGEPFHLVEEVEQEEYETRPDHWGYSFCVAPDAQPEHYATALLDALVDTLLLDGPVTSDYPQWLFKERAEAPFREAMAADPDVVGYATAIFYARLDARAWRADEYDEYMGEGGARDPRVDAVAVVDEGIALEEAVGLAKRLQDSLWEVDTSSRLTLVRRGEHPFRDWLYATETPKQKRTSRGDPPTLEEVRNVVEGHFDRFNEPTPWDGAGDVGDPAGGSTKPQVEWL